MNENDPNNLTPVQIIEAVSASVEEGVDIRDKVRSLTLQALKTRKLSAEEVKPVINAVMQGITLGAAKRAGEVRSALSEGVAGLDDALTNAAEATRLALQQLTSQAKDFSDSELSWALVNLRRLEEEFMEGLGDVTEKAGDKIKLEMKDLLAHVRRTGTDTGTKVSETVNALGSKVSATVREGKDASKGAAREMSIRLASLTSGLLSGMADALHEKAEKLKNK